MAHTRRHSPDDKPQRPRGQIVPHWHIAHSSDKDYRRKPKHCGQEDLLAEYEEEQDKLAQEEFEARLEADISDALPQSQENPGGRLPESDTS